LTVTEPRDGSETYKELLVVEYLQ